MFSLELPLSLCSKQIQIPLKLCGIPMNFTNTNQCHNFEIDENAWQKHDFNRSPLSKELHSSSAQEDQIGTIFYFLSEGKEYKSPLVLMCLELRILVIIK